MRILLVLTLLIICSAFYCPELEAQKNAKNLISGTFRHLSIREFTEEIEKQTSYFFYYDITLFDSLQITLTVHEESLNSVLSRAFQNTDFNYTLGPDNEVYLTKFAVIDGSLAEQTPDSSGKKRYVYKELAKDASSNGVDLQMAALENKTYQVGINDPKKGLANALVSGYIRDVKSGEPIAGASVYVDKPRISVSSDQYGYYAISLPKGKWPLNIQSFGMKDTRRLINLSGDGKLNIDLQGQVMMLKNVTISAEKMSNIRGVQMGTQKLDIKTLKQVPVLFGETDLLRILLTLPGVKSVGEASTGLNVRGGAADQNLFLFNDGTVYNPTHFFGFFSAFNPDIVKSVELYKSSIPARYGGRLSSVVEVTSRLEVEGPLVKDKSSFILSGRTTYADWMLNLLPPEYKLSKASFYDLNL